MCGAEPKDVPPASTQGAQRGAGGDVGTRGSTLQEGVLPAHSSTLSCSTAPKPGKHPDTGAQAGAPASPLARCRRGELAAGSQLGQAEVSLQNLPPPLSPHVLSFSASPSRLPAAAHPDAHQDEGLFAFH